MNPSFLSFFFLEKSLDKDDITKLLHDAESSKVLWVSCYNCIHRRRRHTGTQATFIQVQLPFSRFFAKILPGKNLSRSISIQETSAFVKKKRGGLDISSHFGRTNRHNYCRSKSNLENIVISLKTSHFLKKKPTQLPYSNLDSPGLT